MSFVFLPPDCPSRHEPRITRRLSGISRRLLDFGKFGLNSNNIYRLNDNVTSPKIVLCRDGILLSRRGKGGGFTLARPPQEISLKNIIDLVEGKMGLVACLHAVKQCTRAERCQISPFWNEVQQFMEALTGSITVADLINPEQRQKMRRHLETCRSFYRQKLASRNETEE